MQEESMYRVFVGGLAPSIKENDIKEKFQSFGSTSDVYLVQKKDNTGEILKTFGYVNLKTTEQKLKKCFAIFGQTKWKGHTLKVQLAKDDFMKRLRKEWENPEPIQMSKSRKRKQIEPIKSYEEYVTKCKSVKKLIPGIPIEGEKNWVIAKYGRPLPIVHFGKIPGRKMVKHDPSKHCHCVKRLPDNDLNNDLKGLTWNLKEVYHLQDDVKTLQPAKKKSVQTLSPSKNDPIHSSDVPDKSEKENSKPDLETDKQTENEEVQSKTKKKKLKRAKNEDDKLDETIEVDFEIVKQTGQGNSLNSSTKQRSLVINRGFSESESSDNEEEQETMNLKPKSTFEIIKQSNEENLRKQTSMVINGGFDESESLEKEEEQSIVDVNTNGDTSTFEIVNESSEENLSKSASKQKSLVTNGGFSESESSDSEKEDSNQDLPTGDTVKQASENSSKSNTKQESLVVNGGFSERESPDSEKEQDAMDVDTNGDTSTNQSISLPSTLPSSTPMVRSPPKMKINTNSKLSDSIVKQIQLSQANANDQKPVTPICMKLNDSLCDQENEANSMCDHGSDDEEGTNFNKTNMFDFDFENKQDDTVKCINEADKNDKETEHDEIVDDSEDEESINMFDFEFTNLKPMNSESFFQKMEFRWENEQEIGSESDTDSLSKCENDKETEQDEIANDKSSDDEESINMFDFEFANLKGMSSEDFFEKVAFRWENEQEIGSGSDPDSLSECENDRETEEEDFGAGENSDDEESTNMFDFEFSNLKGMSNEDFLEKMEFRWENEQDVSSESDTDSLSECDDDDKVLAENDIESDANENDTDENSESEAKHDEKFSEISKNDFKKETETIVVGTFENEASEKKTKKKKEKSKNAVTEDTISISETENIEENAANTVSEKKSKKKKEKSKDTVTEEASVAKDSKNVNSSKKKEKKKKDKKDPNTSKHHQPGKSEEARQKSIEIHAQRTQKNKELIKNALKGIDINKPSANRICFDDDDDDDNDAGTEAIENTLSTQAKESGIGKETNSKAILWDEEESDEEHETKIKEDKNIVDFNDENDEEDVDRFVVKKQFQGAEGEKLFKMQLHYGGDERFRLDERFADSDNDDVDDKPVGHYDHTIQTITDRDNMDIDLEEEKERNMSLLESILGKPLQNDKKNKTKFENSNTPYERYDPTKADHTKLEIHLDEESKSEKNKDEKADIQIKKKKTENVETEDNVAPEVSKERFYQVDTSLKSLFSSGNDDVVEEKPATFTFLSVADADDETTNDLIEDDHVMEAKPIKELSWRKGMFEDDVVMEEEQKEEKSLENSTVKNNFGGFFFFKENDERLEKGSAFKRTDKYEDITKQWEDVRQSLHDDFKKKHKDAVRRVRKMKERRSLTRS